MPPVRSETCNTTMISTSMTNSQVTVTSAHLVAVLANPPTTSSERTLARVRLAAEILGYPSCSVVNLVLEPTYRTGGLAQVGATRASNARASSGLSDSSRNGRLQTSYCLPHIAGNLVSVSERDYPLGFACRRPHINIRHGGGTLTEH